MDKIPNRMRTDVDARFIGSDRNRTTENTSDSERIGQTKRSQRRRKNELNCCDPGVFFFSRCHGVTDSGNKRRSSRANYSISRQCPKIVIHFSCCRSTFAVAAASPARPFDKSMEFEHCLLYAPAMVCVCASMCNRNCFYSRVFRNPLILRLVDSVFSFFFFPFSISSILLLHIMCSCASNMSNGHVCRSFVSNTKF